MKLRKKTCNKIPKLQKKRITTKTTTHNKNLKIEIQICCVNETRFRFLHRGNKDLFHAQSYELNSGTRKKIDRRNCKKELSLDS